MGVGLKEVQFETKVIAPLHPAQWDTTYEWKVVPLLALGFGLVGLDRWVVAPLFPAMMADLKLTYQDLGNIVGILAIFWGVFAIFFGGVSDRIGRRKVVIPSLILFSLLSGLTGVASGIVGLLAIRALMGSMEGAYTASSVAATGEASAPKRRGMNQGLQLSAFPLVGLALGPIIATQLLSSLPSWRWVFFLVALPGLILAALLFFVLREPPHLSQVASKSAIKWSNVLRSRNVIVAILSLCCAMSCVFVLGAMVPNYLVDYLKIPQTEMGLLMSALGLGGFVGEFVIATLSDFVGRKSTTTLCFVVSAISVYVLTRIGADFWFLYTTLFVISVFCFGILSMMTGPIASEAVPVGLVASAIGLISGAGEIFGGGIGPVGAGYVAEHYGIQNVLYVSLIGLTIGIIVSLFLKETAPRKLEQERA